MFLLGLQLVDLFVVSVLLPAVQPLELFVVDVLHGDGTHGLAVFLPIIQPVELFVGSMLLA